MRVAVISNVGRPASNSLCHSGSSQDGGMDSSAREMGDGERALVASEHGVPCGKGVAGYMPWIGGGEKIRGCRDGASRARSEEDREAEAGEARAEDLRDRIQWFSESLPVEAPPSGNSPVRRRYDVRGTGDGGWAILARVLGAFFLRRC